MSIKIHSNDEFAKLRLAGELAANLLDELEQLLHPGITTLELDLYAAKFAEKHGAISACYGYKNKNNKPFPNYICTSVNHVICHGIPSEQVLQEGDIVGIDVTLILNGWHGDTCRTFGIGKISDQAQKLIQASEEALKTGIEAANGYIGNIGAAIAELIHTKYKPFSIVEDYCGHGTGEKFHMEPMVPHNANRGEFEQIAPGMVFTIEPMINAGKKDCRLLNDGWTVITKDYSLSAQSEHTIGITENGPIIFTKR